MKKKTLEQNKAVTKSLRFGAKERKSLRIGNSEIGRIGTHSADGYALGACTRAEILFISVNGTKGAKIF